MPRTLLSLALALALLLPAPVTLAQPRLSDNWRADLELRPGAAMRFLGRFASTDVSIYPRGVSAKSTFLRAWSRNGTGAIRVEHLLARLYSDVPIAQIRPTLLGLAGQPDALIRRPRVRVEAPQAGRVRGLDAQRYRMHFSKRGFVDVWTSSVIPAGSQFRRIQHEFLSAVSPAIAAEAARLPGTPVYVELNTPKHQKVVLLRLERVAVNLDPAAEADALSTGSVFVRAPFSDRFWRQ